MLDKYLRGEETLLSRLDDLLDTARRTNSTTVKTAAFQEAQVLATLEQTLLPPATVTNINASTLDGFAGFMDEAYTADMVAKALDETFEGGECPPALKGAVLAVLGGARKHERVGVADSALLNPLADGRSVMVEGDGQPYLDGSGVDFDVEMPEETPYDRAVRNAVEMGEDDFPEFEGTPEADPLEATTKKTKKGGKKTAAQRAAEEAGL